MFAWSSLLSLSAARWLPSLRQSRPGKTVEVGWIVDTDQASFIWDAPERFRGDGPASRHAKSVAVCPAVVDYEARQFVVPCPISARLKIIIDPVTGEANVANVDGDQSAIRSKALGDMVRRVPAKEWRHPQRPMLQIVTPYVFLSDDVAYLNQSPPFNHYAEQQMPGLMIGGRFPIDVWPRHLMWAFEWRRLDRELVLVRGEPWFYVSFDTCDPARQVRLVEAERTPELREYMNGLRGVTNYVNRTFSLFPVARARRPRQLLVKKNG